MNCDRCHRKNVFCTSMSYFNTQMICETCQEIEEKHPKFKEAKERENEEVRKGNYNFPGIGLP